MQRIEMLEHGRMLRQQDRIAAWEFYEQTIQKAAVSMDQDLWVHASLTLSWELIETHQVALHDRAKALITQVEDLAGQHSPYLQLVRGRLLMMEGNYGDALTLLESSYCQDDLGLQGCIEDAIGQCLSMMHSFQAASPHFERALALLTGNSFYQGFVYAHYGEMYFYAQQFDQAEEYFQFALDNALTTGDEQLRTTITLLMARLSVVHKQWDITEALLQDAQSTIEDEPDWHDIAQIHLIRLDAYIAQELIELACACWQQVTPYLTLISNWKISQFAKHLEGKLLIAKMGKGIEVLTTESVEMVEDLLMETAMQYEQQKVSSCQALILKDISRLYHLGLRLDTPYQYQGKLIRALEQGIEVLKQVGLESSPLGIEIDQQYEQAMERLTQLRP